MVDCGLNVGGKMKKNKKNKMKVFIVLSSVFMFLFLLVVVLLININSSMERTRYTNSKLIENVTNEDNYILEEVVFHEMTVGNDYLNLVVSQLDNQTTKISYAIYGFAVDFCCNEISQLLDGDLIYIIRYKKEFIDGDIPVVGIFDSGSNYLEKEKGIDSLNSHLMDKNRYSNLGNAVLLVLLILVLAMLTPPLITFVILMIVFTVQYKNVINNKKYENKSKTN